MSPEDIEPRYGFVNYAEIWNGSTWSAGNAMTIGRSLDSGRAQGSPSSAGGGITLLEALISKKLDY